MTKEDYKIYKENGLCPDCGNKAVTGRVFCFTCLQYRSEIEKERRKAGYIKPSRKDGRYKKYEHERYIRLKAEGMCPYCGQRKVTDGYSTCAICRMKRTEYNRHKRMSEQANK